jgi:putative transposase
MTHRPDVLNVVDMCTRECIGIAADRSFPTTRVTAYLDLWIAEYGVPKSIQVDNGTEFTANEFDAWAYAHKIDVHFITPGRTLRSEGSLPRRTWPI